MHDLEQKNRLLNEKINEIIYNKAAVYKEKTLDVLRKNPEQGSPRGRRGSHGLCCLRAPRPSGLLVALPALMPRVAHVLITACAVPGHPDPDGAHNAPGT